MKIHLQTFLTKISIFYTNFSIFDEFFDFWRRTCSNSDPVTYEIKQYKNLVKNRNFVFL